jgi:hypothetical protein
MKTLFISWLFLVQAFAQTKAQTIVTDSVLYQQLTNNLKTINDSLDFYVMDEFESAWPETPIVATLAQFMKDQPFVIFIGVHTACREGQRSSSEIAQKIADNLQKSVIYNGIERQRLKAYGLEPCLPFHQIQEESRPVYSSNRVTIKMIGWSDQPVENQGLSVDDCIGKVVLEVCVNAKGSVLYVKPDLEKSTSTEKSCIDNAVANAYNWKFGSAATGLQCGSMTYDFQNAARR